MIDASKEFAVFMDTNKMKALFQQELPDCLSGGWMLTDCEIQHPRYKTYLNPKSRDKSYLALAYYLKGVNKQTKKSDDRILYVKAYLGSRSQIEYVKACSEVQPAFQGAVLHIDKYGMVAWYFPFDPALPWLPKLLEPNYLQKYFSEFLFIEPKSPPRVIKDITVNIVNYRPEIRCTYRYEIQNLNRNSKTLYGKTYADDKGAEIQRRIMALYQRAEINSDSFVMARPLGYDATLHTVWLEGVEGKPLIDCVDEGNLDKLMVRLAGHLVDFHSVAMTGLAFISEAELLAEIAKKSAKLQKAFPSFSERIENILSGLSQQLQYLPLLPDSLVHGDFHIEQLLLLDDNRMALFDFDELALGNRLMDVANFSAALHAMNLNKRLTEKIIGHLFNAYEILAGNPISDTHFEWHFRVQLLTRAYRAYIQQKPNHEQLIGQLLNTTEYGYADKLGGQFNV